MPDELDLDLDLDLDADLDLDTDSTLLTDIGHEVVVKALGAAAALIVTIAGKAGWRKFKAVRKAHKDKITEPETEDPAETDPTE